MLKERETERGSQNGISFDVTDSMAHAQLFGELVALARSRLDPRLQARFDAEDIVQSAYRSFFRHFANHGIYLESWQDVCGLLAVITKRKCIRRAEEHFSRKRDVRHEVFTGGGDHTWRLPDRSGPPTESLLLHEATERLLQVATKREKQVLALTMAGRSSDQISHLLGCTLRTVRRTLANLRERIYDMIQESQP